MPDNPRVLNPVTLNWDSSANVRDFRPQVIPADAPVPADVQRDIDEEYGDANLDPQTVPSLIEEVTTQPIENPYSENSEQPSNTQNNPGWTAPPAAPSAPATEETKTPGSPAKASTGSVNVQKKSAAPAR